MKRDYDEEILVSPELVVDHVISNRAILALLKAFDSPPVQLKHWRLYLKSINDLWNFKVVSKEYNDTKSKVEKKSLKELQNKESLHVPSDLVKLWHKLLSDNSSAFSGNMVLMCI